MGKDAIIIQSLYIYICIVGLLFFFPAGRVRVLAIWVHGGKERLRILQQKMKHAELMNVIGLVNRIRCRQS